MRKIHDSKTVLPGVWRNRRQNSTGWPYCYVKNDMTRWRSSPRPPTGASSILAAWKNRIFRYLDEPHRHQLRLRPAEKAEPFDFHEPDDSLPAKEEELSVDDRLDLYQALDALSPDEKSLIILKYSRTGASGKSRPS